MIISDSTPIQFWTPEELTFNQSNPICGLTSACFCLPYECDDEIPIQLQDDTGSKIDLVIYDSNDEEIIRISLDEVSDDVFGTSFIPSELSPDICNSKVIFAIEADPLSIDGTATEANYIQTNTANTNWNLSSNPPAVNIQSTGAFSVVLSENMYHTITPFIVGDTINLHSSVTTGSGPSISQILVDVLFLDASLAVIGTTNIFIGNVSTTQDEDNALIVPSGAVYLAFRTAVSFIAAIGGVSISLDIVESSTKQVKISDCIDIRNNHPCTELLAYTNSTDFDGIVYEISPQPTFYLRIPAQFWKENNPMTQEDSELSNGVIVTRRQSIQEKTLLEIGYVPNYLHKKIQKVLMHETVTIDGQVWKRRDEYEADNIKDYPLKIGSVWLTKYNSVEKNTI